MPSDSRMFSFLVFTVLFVGCQANPVLLHYSFSPAVGAGSGDSFATIGNGRITGVRMWEYINNHIAGIQLCYNGIWDEVVGRTLNNPHEIMLFENEVIMQIYGKYYAYSYIHQLSFHTSRGRSLTAGQPIQTTFNMYSTYEDGELTQLSGAQNGNGITALAAHWGTYYGYYSNSTDITH